MSASAPMSRCPSWGRFSAFAGCHVVMAIRSSNGTLRLSSTRQSSAASRNVTVPTLLERQGDFTDTRASNGQVIAVFNPFNTSTAADGRSSRQPFPNNVVRRIGCGAPFRGRRGTPSRADVPCVGTITSGITHALSFCGLQRKEERSMTRFLLCITRAAGLDPMLYEEVEADQSTFGQAVAVVVLSSVATMVGLTGRFLYT